MAKISEQFKWGDVLGGTECRWSRLK